jgi:integrase
MARKIRYAELETPTARRRLATGKTFWRALDKGKTSIGYRRNKPALPGVWFKRTYRGSVVSKNDPAVTFPGYRTQKIGLADDLNNADGASVLSFGQAQTKALAHDKVAPAEYTVRQAMTDYIEYLRANGKDTAQAQRRIEVDVLPELGDELVEGLTAKRLRKWLADLAARPAFVRSAKGKPHATKRAPSHDDEVKRQRQASANRILAVLKGGLNHAYDEERVSTREAWGRRLKPFKGVDRARLRFLSIEECQRLLNACEPGFRLLVRGALETGCRVAELTRLKAADFHVAKQRQPDGSMVEVGTVQILKSKSKTARHVILTDDGLAFFRQITTGRAGDELMFRNEARVQRTTELERQRNGGEINDDGEWRTAEQRRPLVEALKRAKIKPSISFHGLRHTWASLSVMGGMPLMVVAKNLGHRDTTMVQRHYGHLAPTFEVAAIRTAAPRFGAPEKSNVKALRR